MGRNITVLRARIGCKRLTHPRTGAPINKAKVLVDGVPIPYISDADVEFSDEDVLHISEEALDYFVEPKLDEGVRVGVYKGPRSS